MLTPELEAHRARIEHHAREYGLDFFQTFFEILDIRKISEVAAYGGFPTRYPHWRFGMEFDGLDKGHSYGMQRIYEMVINNDPCYAYLMASNPVYDQKTVIGHVYAHCDFFKNNLWFSKTNRKMMDEMANHAARIRRYIDKYSLDTVEAFLDRALSLDNLIDPHSMFIERTARELTEEEKIERRQVPRIKAKKYMERYINPKEYVEEQKRKMQEEEDRRDEHFPPEPVRDVLAFLIAHAPLKEWQQDILSIVREEAYYFAPQGMTKIMNEGWATYWHSRIMTEKAMDDSELIGYADHYAGVVATRPGQLNPYKLGVELLRDIEERWNKGRFGREYEDCDDMKEKLTWDRKLGLGREKIFEVRKLHNDVTFIDTFLTPEFVRKHKMYTFGYNPQRERWEIFSKRFEDIKQKLLQNLTNGGQPFIRVENGNHDNRGELLLGHQHEGVDLKMDYAQDVLRNLAAVWGRPVNLATVLGEKEVLLRHNGETFSAREVGARKNGEKEEENGGA